jgi:uncharacterized membrane protein
LIALTALKFDRHDGAQQMWPLLSELRRQHLIMIHDAAIISWPVNREKPTTHRLRQMAGVAESSDAATTTGFDDEFVRQAKSAITEGTSALFLLTCGEVMNQVKHSIRVPETPALYSSNATVEAENIVRELVAIGGS